MRGWLGRVFLSMLYSVTVGTTILFEKVGANRLEVCSVSHAYYEIVVLEALPSYFRSEIILILKKPL